MFYQYSSASQDTRRSSIKDNICGGEEISVWYCVNACLPCTELSLFKVGGGVSIFHIYIIILRSECRNLDRTLIYANRRFLSLIIMSQT